MDILIIVLSVISILATIVLSFVIYQLIKGTYLFLQPVLIEMNKETLLFKISPKIASFLFVICFIALVL